MSEAKKNFKTVLKQEKKLVFKSFGNLDAWEIGKIIVEIALERKYKIATRIVVNGNTVFHYGCPGSDVSNEFWLNKKLNTVTFLRHSTLYAHYMSDMGMEDIIKDWHLPDTQYATFGGGFPITIKGGAVIGFIGVSGLPHLEDHDLIVEALSRYLGTDVERIK